MTGLKSGSGDDLWGDDSDGGSDDDSDGDSNNSAGGDGSNDVVDGSSGAGREPNDARNGGDADGETAPSRERGRPDEPSRNRDPAQRPDAAPDSRSATGDSEDSTDPDDDSSDESIADVDLSGIDLPTGDAGSTTDSRPYIVRRAVEDKSVQFERDERLTFFVHDDVAEGERDLVTELQSAVGRDVPKFDVREAVYRAALRNPDDVLVELLKMGYSLDE